MKLPHVLTALLLMVAWLGASRAQAQSGPGFPYDATELRTSSLTLERRFGEEVALSDDGNRALVRSGSGVSVFVRSDAVWSLEATLPGATVPPTPPVALSGDGTVALVAETTTECLGGINNCEVVRVYVRTGAMWTLAQSIEPPHLLDISHSFGHALALSADGSTLLIARKFTKCMIVCPGAAYAYRQNGSGLWELEEELTGPEPGIEEYGTSVALTPDGQMALISSLLNGCPAGGKCGVAYILRHVGGRWVSQGRLTPSQSARPLAVALTANGGIALLGGEAADGNRGAVFVFELSGAVWTERAGFSGAMVGDRLGYRVDLSSSGRIGIVSAPGWDCPAGMDCGAFYWVWRDDANTWHLSAANPLSSHGEPFGHIPVALAADARTALVGVPKAPCVDVSGDDCGLVLVLTVAHEIPTLGDLSRILLVLLLAGGGTWILSRRRLFTSRSMAE